MLRKIIQLNLDEVTLISETDTTFVARLKY